MDLFMQLTGKVKIQDKCKLILTQQTVTCAAS